MAFTLEKISENKHRLKTGAMTVPVVLHANDELLPGDETLAQLENIGKDKRLFDHVAAMSDVHSKKGRKVPTGSVVASENFLMPQINDTAPNCGMRLIKTNLTDTDLTPDIMDRLFKELVLTVPTKKRIGSIMPFDLVVDICAKGISPLLDHLKTRTKNEATNTFARGNLFRSEIPKQDIFDSIPKLFLFIGKYRLGILGAAGNHFLDLMRISDVIDKETSEKFGLFPGQYVFLLHTGSGLLGQYASYMFTPKKKEHLSQQIILKLGIAFFSSKLKNIYKTIAHRIKTFKDSPDFIGYEAQSDEGKMFLTSHKAAANFGFANRSVITHNLDLALEKVFGKQIELELLYDTPHISIERENHFGKDVWVHRNGSVRANGPHRMKNHSVFSQTGEPVFIPSSMGTGAYIATGTDENTSTFFSAPHGTGRRKNSLDDAAKNKGQLFEKMSKQKIRLYNAKSKGVVLQDSSYYKDVEEVINGMTDNKIVNIVAKMEPIAVLMY